MEHANIHGGVVRRLWPSDMPAFRDHLLRLDPESCHDRFAMAVSDEFLVNYAERCFGIDDVIYGYFVEGIMRGAGELRGVGLGLDKGSAEAAFSVEVGWRRRGVGTELLGRIVLAARNRGAETLYMSCLARNRAMQGLAKKFESELQFDADDLTGKLVARTPSAAALWNEWVDDASSFATAMLDLHTRTFSMQHHKAR